MSVDDRLSQTKYRSLINFDMVGAMLPFKEYVMAPLEPSKGMGRPCDFESMPTLLCGEACAVVCLTALLATGREGAAHSASSKLPQSEVIAISPALSPNFKGRALYEFTYRMPRVTQGLTILEYNYTDSATDSFEVNGSGGSNLAVTDLDVGSGKATCCTPTSDDLLSPDTVEITWWQAGNAQPRCKQTVLLDGPVPGTPYGLAVHVFQDGTMQVEIVDGSLTPRLKLSRNGPACSSKVGKTNNDRKFSECNYGCCQQSLKSVTR